MRCLAATSRSALAAVICGALPIAASSALSQETQTSAPWALPSITGIAATNPASWPPPPPPSPHVQALQRLDGAAAEPAPAEPLTLPRIFDLEPAPGTAPSLEEEERAIAGRAVREADALLASGEPDRAFEAMRAAMDSLITPSWRAFMLNRIGIYEFRLGRLEASANHVREAARLAPGNPTHVVNLAAALLTAGKNREALDLLMSVDPAEVKNNRVAFSLHFNLACAHAKQGSGATALAHLNEAARADAAATLASLGDPHLDGIRGETDFQRLAASLERSPTARPGATIP